MIGILFVAIIWAFAQLSPHSLGLLSFEKEAIVHGEWWRMWSAHFTHYSHTQMLINSVIIAVSGLIAGQFAKAWQIGLCFLIAMPILTGLLLVTTPHLQFYRGASGIAAMMWMLAAWFLIVENKRLSLGYWLGALLMLLFAAKLGFEGLMLLSPGRHHASGLNIAWLIQCYGALVGVAFFNGLHQAHLTRSGENPQYRGPYEKLPERLNQPRKR